VSEAILPDLPLPFSNSSLLLSVGFYWLWQRWEPVFSHSSSCHYFGRRRVRSINHRPECHFAVHCNGAGNRKLQLHSKVVNEWWNHQLKRPSDSSNVGVHRYRDCQQHAGHNQIRHRFNCGEVEYFPSDNHVGSRRLRSFNHRPECNFAMHGNGAGNRKLQLDSDMVDEWWKH